MFQKKKNEWPICELFIEFYYRILQILFRKLRHWILEKNLSDFFVFSNFISRIIYRDFIEFWKKIYSIFSFFQILFRELFIKFWKKNYLIFLDFKFCFANYSLNFSVFSKFIFYFVNYWFKFGKFESDQNFDQKLQYKNHILIKKRRNLFEISYYVNIFIFKSLNSFIKSK